MFNDTTAANASIPARDAFPGAMTRGPFRSEQPQLTEQLMVLHRRRWVAAAVFLLVQLLVVAVTFTQTSIYEARVRLLIDPGTPNFVNFRGAVEEGQLRTDYYETQYTLLKSRTLARRTLSDLNLWSRAPFGGDSRPASARLLHRVEATLMSAASSIGEVFRAPRAQASPLPGETSGQSRAIDALLGSLSVLPIRNSRMVDVTFRSPDPALAAEIVNRHAKAYIEQTMEFRFHTSKEATDWLAARLAESRSQVEAAENALQRYRERNDAISLEDRDNIIVQRVTDISVALTRAKTDRIEKEAVYRQFAAARGNPPALDSLPAILGNTFLQQQRLELSNLQRQEAQLAQKLGDRHPEMERIRSAVRSAQARLQVEMAKVVQSVHNDFLSAQAQERSLAGALEAHKREALEMNHKAIEFGVLKREAESARQIYDSLLQRAKEMGVSSELRTSSIRIIDPAEVPQAPITPNAWKSLTRSAAVGLVLAIAVAFAFERLDDRIRRPEDIKRHLGMPVLGLVPLVDSNPADARSVLARGVAPLFLEALRTLRTNVIFASADEGSRSVVVTSTDPSEGKTLVAANLATAFAQAGHRVLLIDADMRRAQVHGRFSLPLEPGLSNILVGSHKPAHTIRKIGDLPLWVLPAGKLPPNPTELLGSRPFKQFLVTLREHFDWVFIDTPPVLAVTDATVAAHGCSGVLFVVGADMVSHRAVSTAVERLGNVRVMGTVLNRVDLHRQAYYYSNHYRKEYSRYYAKRA